MVKCSWSGQHQEAKRIVSISGETKWRAPVQKPSEASHCAVRVCLFRFLVPVVADPGLPLCIDKRPGILKS